jgi:hypothetical protein
VTTKTTDAVIEALAGDLRPVVEGAVRRRIALGLGGGMLFSVAIMLAWLGVRPDFTAAMTTGLFWVKFAYTILFAAAGFSSVERLARPAGRAQLASLAVTSLIVGIAILAISQFAATPRAERAYLLFGSTADTGPWNIIILSLPIFCGIWWALRGLAPTRLTIAGLAAGLMSGSVGAWIYSFHCNESAIPFVAVWYTLGIALMGLLGAITGRYLLRW